MKANKFLIILSPIFNIASAQQSLEQAANELAKGAPISSLDKIFNILTNIAKYTYTAFFIVAVIFIIIAAFNFLTAQGDAEKVKSARAQILWASVSIAIALISVAAAQIINAFLKSS